MSGDGYFGEQVAERYDQSSAEMFDPAVVDPVVDFLAERAHGGRILELGVGTGRIALPLAARGLRVHGIELSRAMAARLRGKPGAEAVEVTVGDFATTRIPGGEGAFSLAFVVWNTIMNLTTQAAQVACFRSVAVHLAPGGCFVVEVDLPDLQRLPPGERYRPMRVTPTRFGFDEYDIANQGLVSHHFRVEDGHLAQMSVPFRYVWPAELDLMAELAGMRPFERWAGWLGERFASDSRTLVAVWQKPRRDLEAIP